MASSMVLSGRLDPLHRSTCLSRSLLGGSGLPGGLLLAAQATPLLPAFADPRCAPRSCSRRRAGAWPRRRACRRRSVWPFHSKIRRRWTRRLLGSGSRLRRWPGISPWWPAAWPRAEGLAGPGLPGAGLSGPSSDGRRLSISGRRPACRAFCCSRARCWASARRSMIVRRGAPPTPHHVQEASPHRSWAPCPAPRTGRSPPGCRCGTGWRRRNRCSPRPRCGCK